ncbi:MAG: acetyl-CoA carboxylase carboxyltransferase subunit beta [Lachnospiraceae bacterium]|nr:acetyl-CoA carboxylase carboxyltransferase subunit beta [Lachnospiraceae bacterium]
MSGLFRRDRYIHIKGVSEEEKTANKFKIISRLTEKKEKTDGDRQEDKQIIVCPSCKQELIRSDVVVNHYICTVCGNYFRVRTRNRIRMVCDKDTFIPWFEEMEISNPLHFPGYEEKLLEVKEKTGLHEGVSVGSGEICGEKVCLGVCDARFLMGSMGHVVGEKITLAVERATKEKLPVILFCCSGGARMQEGIISLMQMAKTSAALKKHADAGLLYVTVLTDPTTGGVTASFAMLGDIILAEPEALIGFAGPRVIEQTIGQKLPKGFQRSEFQLNHGFVDRVVERDDLKNTLYQILKSHRISMANKDYSGFTEEIQKFDPSEVDKEKQAKTPFKPAWEKVKAARSIDRPSALTYIDRIFDDFLEFHGDRGSGDDKAVVGGIAWLYGQPVTVIGIQKGNDIAECAMRNYGMASPEGYRKALRLMKQAEKFHRPVICFINTSGAYPGMEAEEKGQGEAIARNLFEMSGLKVPILSIVIGEGGSGGALGLAVGNEVWMLENSTYSILSPEGFASILWKDRNRAKEAAEVMGITAEDLKHLSVIETIIPEYGNADASTVSDIAGFMKEQMVSFLRKFDDMDGEAITEDRYRRFRKY